MISRSLVWTLPLTLSLTLVTACEHNGSGITVETIRPVKTVTLTERVQAVEQRVFSGVVRAAESSQLSFEVSGKVLDITVEVGDKVAAGQRLAALDEEPFKLSVQSMEADLRKARATYANAVSDYKRKKELSTKGYVSASELDQALAERDTADNAVKVAASQLEIAQLDLRNTELFAPFDGYVSIRMVEPHQELASGQGVLRIDALNAVEVEAMMPENVIGKIKRGDQSTISFPGSKIANREGEISEIGTLAETSNAFPIAFRLTDTHEGLLPGMSAEVRLSINRSLQEDGFLLPAASIVAGVNTGAGRHFVFVYKPDTETVQKKAVSLSGGQQRMARVSDGLERGDIVVIAGASFLTDGMKVRLLKGAKN